MEYERLQGKRLLEYTAHLLKFQMRCNFLRYELSEEGVARNKKAIFSFLRQNGGKFTKHIKIEKRLPPSSSF